MAEFDDQTRADEHVLDVLRTLTPDDFEFETPPASVWSGLSAQLLAGDGASVEIVAPSPLVADRSSRDRRALRWLGAAAAVAAVAAAAVIWVGRGPSESVLATARLTSEGLAGAPIDLVGGAEVVSVDAERVLHLDLGDARPASGEYLELWLIKPDISGMVSLGTVRPDGNYPLPVGLEVGDYPIVDVSSEPYDGDPAHSGASLLRGTLAREDDGTA